MPYDLGQLMQVMANPPGYDPYNIPGVDPRYGRHNELTPMEVMMQSRDAGGIGPSMTWLHHIATGRPSSNVETLPPSYMANNFPNLTNYLDFARYLLKGQGTVTPPAWSPLQSGLQAFLATLPPSQSK